MDVRLGTGEFVIMYEMEGEELKSILKVASPAYQFRSQMRDNNPNLLNRFYQLLNGSYIPAETETGFVNYINQYPIMARIQGSLATARRQLTQGEPIVVWQNYNDPSLVSTKDDRLLNILIAFMMSVPLHRQLEVLGMYDQLVRERSEVITWIRKLEEAGNWEGQPTRVGQIITQSRKYALERYQRGQNRDKLGRALTVSMMTKDNIRNLVNKEEGSSLYRLVKAMKEYYAPSVEEKRTT